VLRVDQSAWSSSERAARRSSTPARDARQRPPAMHVNARPRCTSTRAKPSVARSPPIVTSEPGSRRCRKRTARRSSASRET
jgi:hypothetical protein